MNQLFLDLPEIATPSTMTEPQNCNHGFFNCEVCKWINGFAQEYIQSTPAHVCRARECLVFCKPEHLMCASHWQKVPKQIQQAVWANYRPGHASQAWMLAADAAIGYVARQERLLLTRAEAAALEAYNTGNLNGQAATGFDDLLSRRLPVRRRKTREESVADENERPAGHVGGPK